MRLVFSTLIIALLGINAFSQIGGAGICYVNGNPNTVFKSNIDLRYECSVVLDTSTMTYYDYQPSYIDGEDWFYKRNPRIEAKETTIPEQEGKLYARKINGNYEVLHVPNESKLGTKYTFTKRSGSGDVDVKLFQTHFVNISYGGEPDTFINYNNEIGLVTGNPPNHYANDLNSDQVTVTFTGTGITLNNYLVDNRGAIWEFIINGLSKTIDTYSSNTTNKTTTIFSNLPLAEYTMIGRIIGINTNNVSGQSRGWIRYDDGGDVQANYSFGIIRETQIETEYVNQHIYDYSNLDYAFSIDEGNYWTPYHGITSTFYESDGYTTENKDYDDNYIEINEFEINQKFYGKSNDDGQLDTRIINKYIVNKQNQVRSKGRIEFLRDRNIQAFYLGMLSVRSDIDTILDLTNRTSIPTNGNVLNETRHLEIKDSLGRSGLYINGFLANKRKYGTGLPSQQFWSGATKFYERVHVNKKVFDGDIFDYDLIHYSQPNYEIEESENFVKSENIIGSIPTTLNSDGDSLNVNSEKISINSLQRFQKDLGSNEIYTNENTGIGTNNPDVKLHINSSSIENVFKITTGTDGREVEYRGESIDFKRNGANYIFGSSPNASISLGVGGALERDITIFSNKRIGIGDITPRSKMDVDGDITMRSSTTGNTNDIIYNTGNEIMGWRSNDADFVNTEITGATHITDNTNVKTALEQLDAAIASGGGGSDNQNLFILGDSLKITNGSGAFLDDINFLDQNGSEYYTNTNLGIGIDNPTVKLDVNNASIVESFKITTGLDGRSIGFRGDNIDFKRNGSSYITASSTNGDLVFGTGSAFSNDMQLHSSGNLTIGSVGNTERLNVEGNARFTAHSNVILGTNANGVLESKNANDIPTTITGTTHITNNNDVQGALEQLDAAITGGTSDNWGTQVVESDATLEGNGTTGIELKIAQQGATTNQVLGWDGVTWTPKNDSIVEYTADKTIEISPTNILSNEWTMFTGINGNQADALIDTSSTSSTVLYVLQSTPEDGKIQLVSNLSTNPNHTIRLDYSAMNTPIDGQEADFDIKYGQTYIFQNSDRGDGWNIIGFYDQNQIVLQADGTTTEIDVDTIRSLWNMPIGNNSTSFALVDTFSGSGNYITGLGNPIDGRFKLVSNKSTNPVHETRLTYSTSTIDGKAENFFVKAGQTFLFQYIERTDDWNIVASDDTGYSNNNLGEIATISTWGFEKPLLIDQQTTTNTYTLPATWEGREGDVITFINKTAVSKTINGDIDGTAASSETLVSGQSIQFIWGESNATWWKL